MAVILADLAAGKSALAEVFFLVAVVVFCLAAFVSAVARDEERTLCRVGLAAVALGLLLL